MQRRDFVKVTGTGIAAGLAGCLGGSDDDGNESTPTSGGGDGTSTSAGDDDLTTISFSAAAVGSSGILPTVIKGEELDKANGINLEIERVSPGQVSQLVINRGVELGSISTFGGASANHKGRDIRVFGPILSSHISVIVAEDSSYESWEDLKGEKFGILPEPSGTYYHTMLRLANIDLDMEEDFNLVEGSPPTIQAAFDKGDLEAYVSFPPTVINRLVDPDVPVRRLERLPDVFEEIYGHNLPFHNLAAYQGWIDEDPERAKAAQQTFIDGAKALSEKPVEMLEKHTDAYSTDAGYEMAKEETPPIYSADWEATKPLITEQIEDAQDLGAVNKDWPTSYFHEF